jgi:adenosylhomocysteinase
MADAAKVADVILTTTGDVNVVSQAHFAVLKDGAIIANAGHFNDEINIPALEAAAVETRMVRDFVREYRLADGRRIYLLADGRLVNLSAAEGHPAAVMDMSFANQALSAEYMVEHSQELQRQVHVVPREIDQEIARLKLRTMDIEIDELTPEQHRYLTSWQSGT